MEAQPETSLLSGEVKESTLSTVAHQLSSARKRKGEYNYEVKKRIAAIKAEAEAGVKTVEKEIAEVAQKWYAHRSELVAKMNKCFETLKEGDTVVEKQDEDDDARVWVVTSVAQIVRGFDKEGQPTAIVRCFGGDIHNKHSSVRHWGLLTDIPSMENMTAFPLSLTDGNLDALKDIMAVYYGDSEPFMIIPRPT